jgi:hypothetical protein
LLYALLLEEENDLGPMESDRIDCPAMVGDYVWNDLQKELVLVVEDSNSGRMKGLE